MIARGVGKIYSHSYTKIMTKKWAVCTICGGWVAL